MKNTIITTLLLLLFVTVSAQNQEATLYFKDRTSITGLASFSQGFDRIRFREKRGAKEKDLLQKQWIH